MSAEQSVHNLIEAKRHAERKVALEEANKEANNATTDALQTLIDHGNVIGEVPDRFGYNRREITRACDVVEIGGQQLVLEGTLVHKASGELDHGTMTVSELISEGATTTKSQVFSFGSRVDTTGVATGTNFYTKGFRFRVFEPEEIKEHSEKVLAVTAAIKNPQ